MTAKDILLKAADLVGGDRALTHGDKVENHGVIAAFWNAYLESRPEPGAPLDALDVAHMMVGLKLGRTLRGGFNADDWIDMAGYAAVAGEIAERRRSAAPVPRRVGGAIPRKVEPLPFS